MRWFVHSSSKQKQNKIKTDGTYPKVTRRALGLWVTPLVSILFPIDPKDDVHRVFETKKFEKWLVPYQPCLYRHIKSCVKVIFSDLITL